MAEFFSLPMQLKEEEEDDAIEFFVRLCGDVFLEILVSGNRRQLVNMERADRRIHRLVENFLGKRPFLRLGFAIDSRFLFLKFIKTRKNIHLKINLSKQST